MSVERSRKKKKRRRESEGEIPFPFPPGNSNGVRLGGRELCETLARGFARHVFSPGAQKEAVLFVWGRHFPADATGCVDALSIFLASLLDSKVALKVTPTYLEVFEGKPCLRIPRGVLDSASLKFLDFAQSKAKFLFRVLASATFDCPREFAFSSMSGFAFDREIEGEIDKFKLAWDFLYRLLVLAVETDDGAYVADVFQMCDLAARSVIVDVCDPHPEDPAKKRISAFLHGALLAMKGENLKRKLSEDKETFKLPSAGPPER